MPSGGPQPRGGTGGSPKGGGRCPQAFESGRDKEDLYIVMKAAEKEVSSP